ncbi:glutamate-5-semialdehyde dehydrogenase [Aliikangiella marina]|uniref:Gamma-glutamyl phosphate reductase n=1 Tax=Aliikangiella marina TaxID=1712262 RepID=A0A545THM4_9GAMM|nr:glutamate-5-semialdehyde dehydrogenase [Aliikangiella marina]TQV76712.1 glutamate-5-semialdehyde dehydrogenase [Aliikangiella marina]
MDDTALLGLSDSLFSQCQAAKSAARSLVTKKTAQKNTLLINMANILKKREAEIIQANQLDCQHAKESGLSNAMIDRLTITPVLIQQMQSVLEFVAGLDDPLVKDYPIKRQPSGINVTKKRIPIGVILMIYESRPNVTVEAAALALKSGNQIILRGGKEAFNSNQAIGRCWREALELSGFHQDSIIVLDTTDRSALDALLKFDEFIDLVIPRGGEGLIRHVVEHSHIPVIKHYKGVCHLFVDESANLDNALALIVNGKTQRPGVCNSLEGLLVHQNIAQAFLPKLYDLLVSKNVTIYGCDRSVDILQNIEAADDDLFHCEFLDLKISLKIVDDLDEAIQFIDVFGSNHTEVIVTEKQENANEFINRVDASVVMVNASSRFSDGGELGLGAEIGISTSKLHAYGPMGLESLTSEKFIVLGDGQVRK